MDNFVVSARKYRPSTFRSVVGQQHVTTTLEGVAQGFSGSTPYVVWANWPVLAFCFAVLAVPLARRLRDVRKLTSPR